MSNLDLLVRDTQNYYEAWFETIGERPENARAPTPKEWARLQARLERLFKEAQKLREAAPPPSAPRLVGTIPAVSSGEKFDRGDGSAGAKPAGLRAGSAMDAGVPKSK